MKFLNINATISVKPQFSGEVLKAGTPLDIGGSEANSDAAVGIVASDTAVGAESIAIVTEGTIDITELTASYGSALTDECIAALKGITFLYGGKAVVPSSGGDVLVLECEINGGTVEANMTPNEVTVAANAGISVLPVLHTQDGPHYGYISRYSTQMLVVFPSLSADVPSILGGDGTWTVDASHFDVCRAAAIDTGGGYPSDEVLGVELGDGVMSWQRFNYGVDFGGAFQPLFSAAWDALEQTDEVTLGVALSGEMLIIGAEALRHALAHLTEDKGVMCHNVAADGDSFQAVYGAHGTYVEELSLRGAFASIASDVSMLRFDLALRIGYDDEPHNGESVTDGYAILHAAKTTATILPTA